MSAPFNFGDLVKVSGYYPRVFRVDGYHIDTWYYPGEEWTELVYELADTVTGEYLEAEAEDLMLVTDGGGASMAKQERKPTARELSAKEAEDRKAARKAKAKEIDNLLDMRNWYADQFAKGGSVEDNEKVLAMDCKLKELAKKE